MKNFYTSKYRGKTNSGDWVYGSLVYFGEQPQIIEVKLSPINGRVLATNWAWVKPETVGRYTGHKDCNDNEIYEDDILESPKCKHLVYWNEEKAAFGAKMLPMNGIDEYSCSLPKEWVRNKKIIGNSIENPEML